MKNNLNDILNALLSDYQVKIIDRAFYNLTTRDNPVKYRNSIISQIQRIRDNEIWADTIVRNIMVTKDIDYNEAYDLFDQQTLYILEAFENIMDLIADYDFIIDGTDNFPAKFLINDACVMAKKPFSHAGIIRFKGQLMTYVPGEGPCYRCVFKNPPPKDAVPTCKQAGVIGAMGGVIGSLQAMEAIKYILGVGKLLTGYLLT